MADLIEELMEVLEPFDVTMSAWIRLRQHLTMQETSGSRDPDGLGARTAMNLALSIYLEDQVAWMQFKNGHEACNEGLRKLFGVHDTLIRAGRLLGDPLGDKILMYAAHLAAMGPYGPAVWDRASKVVLAAQISTTEKELSKQR
jgi:hypothetical protein